MNLSAQEITVLKDLGLQYMEIAVHPVQTEKLRLWKSLNRNAMERPMVCIDQLPWNELEGANDQACVVSDPFWRALELNLRQTIYKWKSFPADMVAEPFITIPLSVSSTGYGIQSDADSMELDRDSTAPSKHYNRVLFSLDDVEKIKDMEIIHDEAESRRHFDEANEIFAGIAPVIQGHGLQFHLGVWDKLSEMIGMNEVYLELLDNPEFVHACMNRITEATIAGIKQANDLKVHDDISPRCHCSYVYNDLSLPSFGQGTGSVSSGSWAFGMAQLFTSVSPATTEEFETPYIQRMASYFGNIYYGCCEREDDRLDLVRKIPNVRKVSCSPWSDRKNFAEKIGPDLIMSAKPSPAFLAMTTVNWQEVEDDLILTRDLARANGVNLEYILKDISTVKFDPTRLSRWAEIAGRVVEG